MTDIKALIEEAREWAPDVKGNLGWHNYPKVIDALEAQEARIRDLEADVQSGVEFADGLKARIRELEAERDEAARVRDAHVEQTRNWMRQIDMYAAQIEAAHAAYDTDEDVLPFLSADSEVRARILDAVKAEAWDEGDAARQAFYRAAYDVEVPEGEALALLPKNPHRADRIEQEAE